MTQMPLSFAKIMTIADARRLSSPMTIVADAEQCAALARRFDWVAVADYSAKFSFSEVDAYINMTGSINAKVTQSCVATGEPLASKIKTDFSVRLFPRDQMAGDTAMGQDEVELDSDALDTVFYDDGQFDLGEIIGETLSLSTDPWPRGPDADRWLRQKGIKGEDEAGAFGALAGLRDALASASSPNGPIDE